MPILDVKGLSKHFEGIVAIDRLDLAIEPGEIRGVIGPNGSGKTTLLNLISGVLPATAGDIFFEGSLLTGLASHQITRRGVARTFQIPRLLPHASCLENVMLGAHCRFGLDLLGTYLRLPFTRSAQESEIRHEALAAMELLGIAGSAERLGGDTSWMEEQLLQICRALMSRPRLLLLDEPTAGMGEAESHKVQAAIRQIRQQGVTVVVVAHDLNLINEIAEKLTCISFGSMIAEGPCQAVLNDPKVHEVYLGKD